MNSIRDSGLSRRPEVVFPYCGALRYTCTRAFQRSKKWTAVKSSPFQLVEKKLCLRSRHLKSVFCLGFPEAKNTCWDVRRKSPNGTFSTVSNGLPLKAVHFLFQGIYFMILESLSRRIIVMIVAQTIFIVSPIRNGTTQEARATSNVTPRAITNQTVPSA